MTNQEWLCSLSAKDFLGSIKWLLLDYGKRWTDSDSAIIEWLRHEVNISEDKGMRIEVIKGDEITMPNSLKCKIKHLCHNGTITERERDRILKALEQEPLKEILDKIEKEIDDITDTVEINPESFWNGKLYIRYRDVSSIIDKYKADIEPQESENKET